MYLNIQIPARSVGMRDKFWVLGVRNVKRLLWGYNCPATRFGKFSGKLTSLFTPPAALLQGLKLFSPALGEGPLKATCTPKIGVS